MTEQQIAIDQINDIAVSSEGLLTVVKVKEPKEPENSICIDISIKTGHLPRVTEGLLYRGRERFLISVPADFPFAPPSILVSHTRFAGFPHVQWQHCLCLYQAPDSEWNPSDGMYGFIERLWLWLKRAALNQLDASGEALHPPIAYLSKGAKTVIPRMNTPKFDSWCWLGYAGLDRVHPKRVDITSWINISENFKKINSEFVAAVYLLSEQMPFEYPEKLGQLFSVLEQRGIPRDVLLEVMRLAVLNNQEESPLYVVLGTPMRGIQGEQQLQQHLTAWYLEPVWVKALRLSLEKYSQHEKIKKIGEEVEAMILDWAKDTDIKWCRVLEDRNEIVTRRDYKSVLSILIDRTVSVWGCGALGANVAFYLARAGVKKLILRDNGIVTPGILVRQPFTDKDIGLSKVEVLKRRLERIRPDIEVEIHSTNILKDALNDEELFNCQDIIIDCTASRLVHTKLEYVRQSHRQSVPIVSMMISQQATHGMVVVSNGDYSGGCSDLYRKTKIQACQNKNLDDFIESFYPNDRDLNYFQPEPGCSSPTFVASAADSAVFAGLMLNLAAQNLSNHDLEQPHDKKHMVKLTDIDSSPIKSWGHCIEMPSSNLSNQAQQSVSSYSWQSDFIIQESRRNYEVRLSVEAWTQIKKYIEDSRDKCGSDVETGGLLFGEVDDSISVIWISEASASPPDSNASTDIFICGVEGNSKAHEEKKQRSRESIQYIGLWHTHPNSPAVPSPKDEDGMLKVLSTNDPPPAKSLLLIVGTPESNPTIGTYMYDRNDL